MRLALVGHCNFETLKEKNVAKSQPVIRLALNDQQSTWVQEWQHLDEDEMFGFHNIFSMITRMITIEVGRALGFSPPHCNL